jgi:hypothetical protein
MDFERRASQKSTFAMPSRAFSSRMMSFTSRIHAADFLTERQELLESRVFVRLGAKERNGPNGCASDRQISTR